MNKSNSTTRVRLGTIANSLIESHNKPAAKAPYQTISELQRKMEEQPVINGAIPTPLGASKISGAFTRKIIDLVTSMGHRVSHFIEPV